jgi:hypothetical protein
MRMVSNGCGMRVARYHRHRSRSGDVELAPCGLPAVVAGFFPGQLPWAASFSPINTHRADKEDLRRRSAHSTTSGGTCGINPSFKEHRNET